MAYRNNKRISQVEEGECDSRTESSVIVTECSYPEKNPSCMIYKESIGNTSNKILEVQERTRREYPVKSSEISHIVNDLLEDPNIRRELSLDYSSLDSITKLEIRERARLNRETRMHVIVSMYNSEEANVKAIGDMFGVSETTVYRDLKQAREQNILVRKPRQKERAYTNRATIKPSSVYRDLNRAREQNILVREPEQKERAYTNLNAVECSPVSFERTEPKSYIRPFHDKRTRNPPTTKLESRFRVIYPEAQETATYSPMLSPLSLEGRQVAKIRDPRIKDDVEPQRKYTSRKRSTHQKSDLCSRITTGALALITVLTAGYLLLMPNPGSSENHTERTELSPSQKYADTGITSLREKEEIKRMKPIRKVNSLMPELQNNLLLKRLTPE